MLNRYRIPNSSYATQTCEHNLNCDGHTVCILLVFPEYALVIAGHTVEVVSPDPISNPVLDSMKGLRSFPTSIHGSVGTTFGKLNIVRANAMIWFNE